MVIGAHGLFTVVTDGMSATTDVLWRAGEICEVLRGGGRGGVGERSTTVQPYLPKGESSWSLLFLVAWGVCTAMEFMLLPPFPSSRATCDFFCFLFCFFSPYEDDQS